MCPCRLYNRRSENIGYIYIHTDVYVTRNENDNIREQMQSPECQSSSLRKDVA